MAQLDFDTSVPNAARIYDYLLGGEDNYAADRVVAEQLIDMAPDALTLARDNRRFLGRAIRYVAQSGITQFIDIGSGLPTAENTHQVAQAENPGARVLYVDYDPLVAAHARALLGTDQNVDALTADLRDPRVILEHAGTTMDLAKPVAVLLVAVLHFVDDDTSYKITAAFKQAMPPGSCLVLSHATGDGAERHEIDTVQSLYATASAPIFLRTRDQVFDYFTGMTLAEPGLVGLAEWRNEVPAGTAEWRSPRPARVLGYGGVAWKPRAK